MGKFLILGIAFIVVFLVASLFLYMQTDTYRYGHDVSERLEKCARIDADLAEGRAYCFTSVAIKAKDPSICSRIPVYPRTEGTYSLAKSSCEKQVREAMNESSVQ